MTTLRSLRIRLGQADVGSLFALDDGRVYFRFDDAYAKNPARPVLSQLYVVAPERADGVALAAAEAATVSQLLDPALAVNRGDGRGGRPPFFQNLLPEGQLRRQLVADLGLPPDDEFGLLAACGKDLPGNVWAWPESLAQREIGRLLGQGQDSYEMSSQQEPTPGQTSISGVQPKVALVQAPGGRFVMRAKDASGRHFIGKLPTSDFQDLPRVEYASLALARAAGVNTCEARLMPLSAIEQAPALAARGGQFLLVSRFDRDAPTPNGRRHMEDFAQVTGTPAGHKYAGTYAAIGYVLKTRSARGVQDVCELLRRIKVCELLGNYDAHLKNFSLLYDTGADGPVLSPAYDIVAYGVYLNGRGHALAFTPDQGKGPALLLPATVRRLANIWRIPEKRLSAVVADTVDQAMRAWPALLNELPLRAEHRRRLAAHIRANPSAQAWLKRHGGKWDVA